MDEIESSIALPPEALPLQSYARYYTEWRGSVHAAYTTEIEEMRPVDYGCDEMDVNGSLVPVACPAVADLRPGNRRWVQFEDYPAVADRDCTAVQIEFDPKTKTFISVECSEPLH